MSTPLERPTLGMGAGPEKEGLVNPPVVWPTDIRATRDVHLRPHAMFYDPNSLAFPNTMKPPVPGDGGVMTMGVCMVAYDEQAQWDRGDTSIVGPVRKFFKAILFDNRVKHV